MKIRSLFLSVLTVVVAAAGAHAVDIKLGGLIYAQYAVFASSTDAAGTYSKGRGDFSVSRIYVIGEAKFSPKLKGRIVLEGNTVGQKMDSTSKTSTHTFSGTVPNNVFLKNALLEFTDIYPGASANFGLTGTPWITFEDAIWGHRYVSKTLVDQEGVVSASDKGVGLLGKMPKDYGSYHLVYANGEGFCTPEKTGVDGRFKDIMTRLSVCPAPQIPLLAGLQVHGYIHDGRSQSGQDRRRDRLFYAVSYQHTRFHLMTGAFDSSTGNGTANVKAKGASVHGSLNLPKDFALFARQDRFDENKDAGGDVRYRTIAGVERKLADTVRVSLSNQSLAQETTSATRRNENQWLAQLEVKF